MTGSKEKQKRKQLKIWQLVLTHCRWHILVQSEDVFHFGGIAILFWYICHSVYRRCLHDTGATFPPKRVHSGSLSWLYICLHDTTTKCHAGASHPGVSSPRLLYRGENFTPVRNLATVSCKRETTTRFGVKSVCQWTGTGSACVMFAILNHTYILLTSSVPSDNEMWNDPVSM